MAGNCRQNLVFSGMAEDLDFGLLAAVSQKSFSGGFKSTGAEAANPEEVWRHIQTELKGRLDEQIFAAWIKPLRAPSLVYLGNESQPRTVELTLRAPHRFAAEHLKSHYSALISQIAAAVLKVDVALVYFGIEHRQALAAQNAQPETVQLRSSKPLKAEGAAAKTDSAPAPVRAVTQKALSTVRRSSTAEESNLNGEYNFSNFVVGACNQFAQAVSLQVAENLGAVFNPLFIYGGVGLGKTHLVNAIGNAARRRGKKVLLVSSESFVNELITALRSNRMQQFKSRFRSLDLLIIDDVQFIIGKERTQEEFFHTFNDLHQRKKQIILTSDKLPQKLNGLEERLRTRFASGLLADLQAPDFETRVAILVKKAESNGIELPNEVAQFIAEKVSSNIRELEGALNRLGALANLHSSPLSLQLAEKAVSGYATERKQTVSVETIQKFVAERHSVSLNDLLGKRRSQNIALARQVAMYLARRLTGCSFPEIGALFGGRDHSTVIHATKVIDERMSSDTAFKKHIEDLTTAVLS